MTNHDNTVYFALKLMAKDLQYAQDAASATGIALTTAANARALFEHATELGFGDKDMSAVVEPVRDSSRS